MKRLQSHPGSGCILAHCMGLGKTYQVITLIHTLFAHPVTNTKRVLVICPLSTVLNWENEFKIGLKNVKHSIHVFLISEQTKSKVSKFYQIEKWSTKGGVLIMGYEAFVSMININENYKKKINYNKVQEALLEPGPDLIVCDEGHLLKNGKNNRTKTVMRVKTNRRIILTGTPIQNNLKEYYYMVQFVKPNLLGSFKEFTNRFMNPIENGQWHDSTEADIKLMKKRSHVLHKLLKGTIQRYEVSELQSYLPEKIDYVLFIKLHEIQARLYKKYVDHLQNTGEIVKGKLFQHFHQLHPFWTHPYVLNLKEKNKDVSFF